MNVFLDTNVVIDFMGEREGFFKEASAIPQRVSRASRLCHE